MLETRQNKVTYQIGSEASYPFNIRFIDPSNIHCYLNQDLTVRELESGEFRVEYKESYENGSNIILTMNPMPASGTLTIMRILPETQDLALPNTGKLPSESMEIQLDKIIMLIQQLKEELERCIKVAIASGESPEALLKSIFMAKDSALTAAQASANSAEASATLYAQMAWIWTEITGDDTLFEKAFITAKEAAEATGAIDTAAEAAKAGINEASQAALNHALAEVKEAKESSLDALETATGSANASIDLKISEAIGADGTLTVMKDAAEQALADAKANSESIQASMNAAKDVVDSAVAGALQRAEEAVDRGEQVEQSVLTALQNAQNAASSASGSATSALQQAQAAADAKVAAESAKAAAEAAAGEAGSLVNASVTAHNSNPSAHTAIQNKFANYLPLAGGTMTGAINKNGILAANPTEGGNISLLGGQSSFNNGAALVLYDKNCPDRKGYFLLQASDGTNIVNFHGRPDGTLVWGNFNVLRDYFARVNTTGSIRLYSGPDYLKGGYLQLYGKDASGSPGTFSIGASNGTTSHELKGTPDGQLTWDGKTILNDGRDAVTTTHTAGSGTSFVWYRKHASGWVEQGGFVAANATSITFPVAFLNTDYCLLRTRLTQVGNDISDHCQNISTRSATGFTIDSTYAPTNGSWWYACGKAAS